MANRENEKHAFPLRRLHEPPKGRGAVSNLQGRYELQVREDADDGWQHVDEGDAQGKPSRKPVSPRNMPKAF